MIGGGLALGLFGDFQGFWLAAVGWFLAMAAGASYKQFRTRQRLQSYAAQDLMSTSYPTIPAGTTLETLAKESVLPSRHDFYVVSQGDRCLGLITLRTITQVPRNRWATTPVDEAMRPLAYIPSVGPATDANQAIELMEEQGSPLVLVMDGERLLGFITQEIASRALRAKRVTFAAGKS
jgi:CBS domain-containing protein